MSSWRHQHEHVELIVLFLRTDLCPTSCMGLPEASIDLSKLQGRLWRSDLARCSRFARKPESAQEDHCGQYSHREHDMTVFWSTLHEWAVAPSRCANVVLLLDAKGRVVQDYRCTGSHETTNDWVSVTPDGSEVTSPNGKRLVLHL